MRYQRVPADRLRPGDVIGEGRWQGVRVVSVYTGPNFQTPGAVQVQLGTHGAVDIPRDERVLIEARNGGWVAVATGPDYCRNTPPIIGPETPARTGQASAPQRETDTAGRAGPDNDVPLSGWPAGFDDEAPENPPEPDDGPEPPPDDWQGFVNGLLS